MWDNRIGNARSFARDACVNKDGTRPFSLTYARGKKEKRGQQAFCPPFMSFPKEFLAHFELLWRKCSAKMFQDVIVFGENARAFFFLFSGAEEMGE